MFEQRLALHKKALLEGVVQGLRESKSHKDKKEAEILKIFLNACALSI